MTELDEAVRGQAVSEDEVVHRRSFAHNNAVYSAGYIY